MKIAVLTMFNGLSTTYSLVNVVAEQLQMLLDDDHEVRLLVCEHCPDSERSGIYADARLQWVKVTNTLDGQLIHWHTYTRADEVIHESFDREVQVIANDYIRLLTGCELCIMHDILYQGVHLVHNAAIRLAQQSLPELRFLAFTHSAPATRLDAPAPISFMFSPMPRTTYVYPTECGLPALAAQYGVPVAQCACVGNSVDPLLGLSQAVRGLFAGSDLLSRDILVVCPARLTLAKRFHVVAELCGVIKTYCHRSIGVIFCDFSSADIDPELYRFMVRDIGRRSGLVDSDIVFTSQCGFPNGVPRSVVMELFTLSNLFLCPSYSESFGLTVVEAASRGNLVVLNEAVPALAEVGSSLGAYFMRWSARGFGQETHEHYHPSEELYYLHHARRIVEAMDNDRVLLAKTVARQRYSTHWVYHNQLKRLL